MPGRDLPKRKDIRLHGYDYSSSGAYFITICTKGRDPILGDITVGAAAFGGPYVTLSPYGKIVEQYINNINVKYQVITVPIYCIMPNHVHLLVVIDTQNAGITEVTGSPRAATPTIPKIINSLKLLATKDAGLPLWQRGYYEHIIRNEQSYCDAWRYIEDNPAKWAEDKYYL